MSILGPILNRKNDLSLRNGVLQYKQVVRPPDGLCVPRVEVLFALWFGLGWLGLAVSIHGTLWKENTSRRITSFGMSRSKKPSFRHLRSSNAELTGAPRSA
jgi:hypothetical protein